MELQDLLDEYAQVGIGDQLYAMLLRTVRAVTLAGRYPESYSPTRRWDEDGFTGLAHDWAVRKLLGRGHLRHLLLSNRTLRGFRTGLELSFRDFLIGQRKRTALDNLFHRAHSILEHDPRFRRVVHTERKAMNVWGLARWPETAMFQGSETDLIAAGFRIRDIPVIRYRADAKKLSPTLSGPALAEFLIVLLESVGAPLSLTQMMTVFAYRFDLLGAEEVSLDATAPTESGETLPLSERIPSNGTVEDTVLIEDAAGEVLREMSTRQQNVLVAYARPGATLESVAEQLGCSKSTVDNERRRAVELIRRRTDTPDEAEAVYVRVMEILGGALERGNPG